MYFYSGSSFRWALIKRSIYSGSLNGELGRGLEGYVMKIPLKLLIGVLLVLLFAQIAAGTDADDLIKKGQVYESAGKYEDALKLYDQAILLDPNESYLYLPKYDLLRKTGRFEEAKEIWDLVMDLLPNSTEPIYYYSFVA